MEQVNIKTPGAVVPKTAFSKDLDKDLEASLNLVNREKIERSYWSEKLISRN